MEETDDKVIEEYVLGQFSWERLPPAIRGLVGGGSSSSSSGSNHGSVDSSSRSSLGSNSTGTVSTNNNSVSSATSAGESAGQSAWRVRVIRFSLKRQLRWKTNLVRQMVPDERNYYVEMLKYCQQNLMLFPYHISDVLVRGLRVSPFTYYREMMLEVMKNELSYDRVPNFPAADSVRLLDIGRNEYIDIMNKSRQQASSWLRSVARPKVSVLRDLLPAKPRPDLPLSHWWIVNAGFIDDETRRSLDPSLADVLTQIERAPAQVGTLDRAAVRALYAVGVVYFDVPIDANDRISIPPLENFVMNRVGGDYFENLLYKIFVSTDERTTVRQLAEVLGITVESACQAVSVYCRLGFATNKNAERLDGPGAKWHSSWLQPDSAAVLSRTRQVPGSFVYDDEAQPLSVRSVLPEDSRNKGRISVEAEETERPQSPVSFTRHVGFVFDYTLTALLMMGNLGSGLKKHAITMYEVGKLSNESVHEFIQELAKVPLVSEGEAQNYHDHAIALRQTLEFFRSLDAPGTSEGGSGHTAVDLLRIERLVTLDKEVRARMLRQHYDVLVSVTPLAPEAILPISTAIPRHFGPALPEFASRWFRLFCYSIARSGPASKLFRKGSRVSLLPIEFRGCQTVWVCPWRKDPQEISIRALLCTLNDLLLESPVLVQARSHFGDEAETVNIPFPLKHSTEPPLSGGTSTSKQCVSYSPDMLASHPAILRLSQELRLDLCPGYVRMLRLDTATATGSREWVPIEVCFGVPLFDVELNRAVLKGMSRSRLFEKENLAIYSRHVRKLSLRLLDFIARYCDGMCQWNSSSPLDMNLPSQNITFAGSELRFSQR